MAGVKRIRIHDLRHSHISLLIDMGFTALAIADRVGHESIDITYRYALTCSPPGRRRWRTDWTWRERGLKSCQRKILTGTTDGEIVR